MTSKFVLSVSHVSAPISNLLRTFTNIEVTSCYDFNSKMYVTRFPQNLFYRDCVTVKGLNASLSFAVDVETQSAQLRYSEGGDIYKVLLISNNKLQHPLKRELIEDRDGFVPVDIREDHEFMKVFEYDKIQIHQMLVFFLSIMFNNSPTYGQNTMMVQWKQQADEYLNLMSVD